MTRGRDEPWPFDVARAPDIRTIHTAQYSETAVMLTRLNARRHVGASACGFAPRSMNPRVQFNLRHARMPADALEFAHSRVPPIGFSGEKLRVYERAKQPLAFPLVQVPETLRLRKRQLQARHFQILSTNPIQELRVRRKTAGSRRLFGDGRPFARRLCHRPRGNHCRAGFSYLSLRGWPESRGLTEKCASWEPPCTDERSH